MVLAVAASALARPAFDAPDPRVEAQSVATAVAVSLIITPSYSTAKPGATVTVTNCKAGQGAPIRLVRRFGTLHSGETLRARPGRIVWDLAKIPGRPAKRKLRLNLAKPTGAKSLCLKVSIYDKLTKNSATIVLRVPL